MNDELTSNWYDKLKIRSFSIVEKKLWLKTTSRKKYSIIKTKKGKPHNLKIEKIKIILFNG